MILPTSDIEGIKTSLLVKRLAHDVSNNNGREYGLRENKRVRRSSSSEDGSYGFKDVSMLESADKAESHRQSEQRRRDKVNSYLLSLKELLPACSTRKGKVDKATMISLAVEYIIELKDKVAMLETALAEAPSRRSSGSSGAPVAPTPQVTAVAVANNLPVLATVANNARGSPRPASEVVSDGTASPLSTPFNHGGGEFLLDAAFYDDDEMIRAYLGPF